MEKVKFLQKIMPVLKLKNFVVFLIVFGLFYLPVSDEGWVFLKIPEAQAAIAVDDTGQACAAAGTTIDITGATHGQTVGAGSNMILLVTVSQGNTAATLTSVTWDQGGTNQLMERINGAAQATDARVELWKLVAPTAGNKDLRIVSPSSVAIAVGLVSYTGINQTTPNDTSFTAAGTTGTNPSVGVTNSAVDDLVVDAVVKKETAGTNAVATSPQTERYEIHCNANDEAAFGSEKAGAGGTVTMSWTGPNEEWAQIGVSLNPAAGGAVVRTKPHKVRGRVIIRGRVKFR